MQINFYTKKEDVLTIQIIPSSFLPTLRFCSFAKFDF